MADDRLHLGGRGLERYRDVVAVGDGRYARAEPDDGISAGDVTWAEAGAGRRGVGQAVQAEAAPVGAVEIPGDEVPAPAERHEPMRLDVPGGESGDAVGARVAGCG